MLMPNDDKLYRHYALAFQGFFVIPFISVSKLIILVLALHSAFHSIINFGGWISAHEASTTINNASLLSRTFVLGAFVQGNFVPEAFVQGGLCLEAFVLLQYLLVLLSGRLI